MKFMNCATLTELENYMIDNKSIVDEFGIAVDSKSVGYFLEETIYDGYLDCDSQLFIRNRTELIDEIKEFESNTELEDYKSNQLLRSKILLKLFDEYNIDNIIITRG